MRVRSVYDIGGSPRYAYQEEVRFVPLPPQPTSHLDPLFIQLGSLEDISDTLYPGAGDGRSRYGTRDL